MKLYIAGACAALLLAASACDDQVMEWKAKDSSVKGSELPMELQEQIAHYDFIKNYVAQYHPNLMLSLGMSLDMYLDNEEYRQLVHDNFNGITFGNAMKHQSIVQTNGSYNWTKVDRFFELNPDMPVYGHNLLWHTQQQQGYLKRLIAPEQIIESSGDDGGIQNIITNSDFESGSSTGWSGWSHYDMSVQGPGHDSSYALKCVMDNETAQNYDCQLWWSVELVPGETYAYRFYAKSPDGVEAQFVGQNADYSGLYKTVHSIGTDWTLCEGEFTYSGDPADVCRVGIQFGGIPGSTLWVDDFLFGLKLVDPDAQRINLIKNGDFASDVDGWQKWNGTNAASWNGDDGNKAKGCMVIETATDAPSDQWKEQFHADLMDAQPAGTHLYISYFIKVASGEGSVRCSTTGKAHYQGDQDVNMAWKRIDWDFTVGDGDDGVTGLNFDLGAVANTYFIDDVIVSTDPIPASAMPRRTPGMRATTITFKPKSLEEKQAILTQTMEEWIKEAMTHCGAHCPAWDVINEPIGDNCRFRGVEGGWMDGDSEPVEDTTSGLQLNWANDAGNGHFYWGYYLGMDYAVKAFSFARQYAPVGTQLFVNDYNLESNPQKLAKLIEFVNYIDANGAHVDGIGTQMHVQSSITQEQVDAMFQTMAATGKLVRITELDVAVGSSNPSAEQQLEQADAYKMIIESYLRNVPEAQQSAITIWGLSDNAKEHEYWLKDDSPNIFDGKYQRKAAYKAVCDAIAGYDISTDFHSIDYHETAKQAQ